MGIYPITNKVDHERALKRIEALMDAEKLMAEEVAELDALVTLVEVYEDKHFPISAPTPIAPRMLSATACRAAGTRCR